MLKKDCVLTRNLIFVILIILLGLPLGAETTLQEITIQKGDTLYSIASRHGISVNTLLEHNKIKNPDLIYEGMNMVVPVKKEYKMYTVAPGDTLFGISRRYETTVSKLQTINNFTDAHILRVGDKIRLPVTINNKDIDYDKKDDLVVVDSSITKPQEDIIIENKADETQDTHLSADEVSKRSDPLKQPSIPRSEIPRDTSGIIWPHSGDRADLVGRMQGTKISGDRGDIIISVSSGRVVWAAPYRGYGNLVLVETTDGYIYAYGGNEDLFVEVGDRVNPGTKIGSLGVNPIERSPKIFFFVYKDGQPIDPSTAPRS